MRHWQNKAVGVLFVGVIALTPSLPAAAQEPVPDIPVFTSEGVATSVQPEEALSISSDEVAPSAAGSGNLDQLEQADLDPEIPEDLTEKFFDSGDGTGARSVIGPDARTQVADTSISPYIQMPFIGYRGADGAARLCTGWLNGPHSIATAAHCLYDAGPSTDFTAYFGLNGTSAVAACTTTYTYVPPQWISGQAPEFDWGVLQLNCNAGEVFGHLGFRIPTNLDYASTSFFVTGYPGDKAVGGSYTMWQAAQPIADLSVDGRRLYYGTDTAGGQSGAPVWRVQGGTCGNCAIGIHTYGVGGGSTLNSGSRINADVMAILIAFRDNYFI
jgi:glutamyl endopeptidase